MFQTVNQNGLIFNKENKEIKDKGNVMLDVDRDRNSNQNQESSIEINNNVKREDGNYQKIVLKGDPVSLVCQNINYFIGFTR